MADLPNYADPEIARLIAHWETTMVLDQASSAAPPVLRQATPTCPVCRYAMAERGDPLNTRVVCTWNPDHTPG